MATVFSADLYDLNYYVADWEFLATMYTLPIVQIRCTVAVSRGHGDFKMFQGRTQVQGAHAIFSLTPIEAYTY